MILQLHLEWLRLKGFRFFWTFLVGYFVCLLLTMWVGAQVMTQFFDGINIPGISKFGFSDTLSLIFYFSGFYESFLAMILIMMISNDYALGTLKQHVIDGLSYEGVVLGRLVQVLLLMLISFCMVLGLAVVFAGQVSGEAFELPRLSQLVAYFLRSAGYLSFAVLLASMMKKAIPTVLVYMGVRFFLEPAAGFLLEHYFKGGAAQYLPLEVFGNLVDSPQQILSLSGVLSGGDSVAQVASATPFYLAFLYFLVFWGAIYALVKFRRFQ